MIFAETKLQGAYVIDIEKNLDERGFFARTWCAREFEAQNLAAKFVQANVSFNRQRGTLRGMHFQASPHEECKLIRCTRGVIYCVLLDLREASSTERQWAAQELTAENYRSLFVPKGVAVGFLTLEDNSEVIYQMSEFYAPGSGRGYRYDDPAFAIDWPIPVQVISEKDRTWPYYAAEYAPQHSY